MTNQTVKNERPSEGQVVQQQITTLTTNVRELQEFKLVSEEKERCRDRLDKERDKLINEKESRLKERGLWMSLTVASWAVTKMLLLKVI